MRKNVGGLDRIARIVLGAGLVYAALTRWKTRRWSKLVLGVGVNLLSTGLSQRCPVNAGLGRDTASGDGREQHLSDAPA